MNERQAKFCREYLLDGNGRQAAIRAGYSAATAEVQASRLLTYDNVRGEIERLRDEANRKAEEAMCAKFIDKRRILNEIIRNPKIQARDRIRAIEVDNLMAGDSKPPPPDAPIQPIFNFFTVQQQKVEVNGSDGKPKIKPAG